MKVTGWTIASGLAIVCYATLVVAYSDKLPKYDDLHDAFGFFIEYHKADSLWQKLQSLFYPNNEHITLFNHLIYLLQVNTLGELDFQQLVWLGNIIIIATALLASRLPQPRLPYLSFIIIAGYLSLSFWDSSFKAMTALSNQAVIFFALLSLLLAERKYWGLSVCAAVACHFSQSNGILIWPLLILMALFETDYRYKKITFIAAVATLSIALYYISLAYYKKLIELNLPGSLKTPDVSFELIWQMLAAKPLLPLHAFINFIGSAWVTPQYSILCTAIGAVLLFMCGASFFLQRRLLLEKRALFLFLGFLVASMALIAATRAFAYQDVLSINVSRYKMYPLLFSLLTLTLYLPKLEQRAVPLISAAVISLLTLSALPGALINIQQQTLGIRNSLLYWIVDGDFRRFEAFHIHHADLLYFHAEYLGVWDPYRSAGVTPLRLEPTQQSCATAEQLPFCSFQLQHRLNGIAAQLINPSQLEAGSRLQLCSAQHSSYLSEPLTEEQRLQTRLLIDRARISHEYQYAILRKNNTALCQTPLLLSSRDREQEITANLSH